MNSTEQSAIVPCHPGYQQLTQSSTLTSPGVTERPQWLKCKIGGTEIVCVLGALSLDRGQLNLITAPHECKIKKDDDYSNCGNGW